MSPGLPDINATATDSRVDAPASIEPQASAAVELGTFVHGLDAARIPQPVLARARTCLLYGLGIGLLCVHENYARIAEQAFGEIDAVASPGSGATSWRSGRRLGLATAAACNTVLMHSRCQEDTYGSAHLGIVVIPTALALIEAGYGRAQDLVPAMVAGYEAAGALERCLGRKSTAQGFRASPLYGSIAGAASAAKLLGLDLAATTAAISNAAAFSGGTLQAIGDGTDEWRYQMAVATRRAIEAAFLARAGSVTTPAALDGARGFAAAFARCTLDGPLLPGQPWALETVAFKPYPVCNRNQTAAALAAQLHDQLRGERVTRVRFRINSFVEHGMLSRGPFQSVAGTLMSTYFACAAALAHGTVSREMLETFDDPDVHNWMDRISIEPDDRIPYPSAQADVELADGGTRRVELRRTFSDYALPRQDVVKLLERLAHESRIGHAAVAAIDGFAFEPQHTSITPVLSAFEQVRSSGSAPHQETPPC